MLRLKALATLAAIAMLAVPTARAEQPHPFAGHRQVTVMSQNLYLGTDLNPIFAAANPFALFAAVGAAWGQVQANDFPARAQVIANEIAVLPVGAAGVAKAINADLDAGIKKNLDAELLAHAPLHDQVHQAPLRPRVGVDPKRAVQQPLKLFHILLLHRHRLRQRHEWACQLST